jgi:uncharacterized membrane protein
MTPVQKLALGIAGITSLGIGGAILAAPHAFYAYALVAGVFPRLLGLHHAVARLTGGVGGVEAMQVINREVFRWVFMALFLGMAAGVRR